MWLRFARLWPVHLVTLLAVVFFIRADSRQFPGTGFFDPAVVFVSNLTLTHSLVPFMNYTFSWNSVSWSISTEMFFYLAFPFLLAGFNKNWFWKLGASVALLGAYAIVARVFKIPAYSAEMTDLSVNFMIYASPLARGFEFVLGMVAYLGWRALMRSPIKIGTLTEVAAVSLMVYWFAYGLAFFRSWAVWDPTIDVWYSHAGSSFVCAVLIIAFASAGGMFGRLFSLKPLVWLGDISFALYMCHQITLKWFKIQEIEGKLAMPPVWVAVLVCIALAAILHHAVEMPAQRGLKWLRGLIGRRRSVSGNSAELERSRA